jgi:hypothetical protein
MTYCVIVLLSTKIKKSDVMSGFRHYAHYDILTPKHS